MEIAVCGCPMDSEFVYHSTDTCSRSMSKSVGNCLSCAALRAELSDATALAYNLDPNRTDPEVKGLCEQINHLGEHITLLERVAEAAREILANGYDQGRRITLRAALSALNPLDEKPPV